MPRTTHSRTTRAASAPAAAPAGARRTPARHERAPRRRREPEPPFPAQHQPKPGIESRMRPRPRYQAPEYRAAGKLEGKVALVTGGDSGIGRAVATLFAREGADVAIVFLPVEAEDAEETREAIEAEGRNVLLLPGDVSDPDFCRQAVERTVERLGALHVLVNNAAFQQSHDDPEDISLAQWDRTFRTNVHGYFYMVKAALQHLEPGAAIVNTASITGLEGDAHLLDYSSTKGAILAFTKSLAQMLVSRGIRVNAVAPGPVWTPLNPSDRDADQVEQFGQDVPMKRPAQPEEIAPAYVYFASEADSSYVTGEVLALLGGETTAG
ncbi:MAG TPA: SDR family oxidoreductase [Candidatus Eisenbacteria bacterium]|nr:SDR family oxidoreductase [Candidatus Eisenbacteria bacterium]